MKRAKKVRGRKKEGAPPRKGAWETSTSLFPAISASPQEGGEKERIVPPKRTKGGKVVCCA